MLEIFIDALLETINLLPFLLLFYIGIELIEYQFGSSIRKNIQKAGNAGPALGAFIGSFPQCGFSVVGAALYTQRLVTIGTFLAVLLATSDEAIPIILSHPDKAGLIFPLILTKIIIAVIAGYAVDLIFKKSNQKTLAHINAYNQGTDDKQHNHGSIIDEPACCGHSTSPLAKKFSVKEIFIHPILHTAKIFTFILIITLFINLIIFNIGAENLAKIFSGHIFWQPFLAALIGLIPNCVASVTITQLYLEGIISYGAIIAGLCASGGLGILVLFKEGSDKKDIFKVIGLLFTISVLAGLIIEYCF